MKLRFAVTASILLASWILNGCVEEQSPSTQSALEERITCQCGCGLTVHTCNHLQCSFGIPVKKDIAASLAAGQTGEEIIGRYVKEYGEKILSSPTTKGFNLLAWYGPYIALLAGAATVLVALRRFRKRPPGSPPAAGASIPVSEADRLRIERELEQLE